jgi:hypothetical protein
VSAALLACSLVSALLLAGCSDDEGDGPDVAPQTELEAAAPAYDPELEAAAAVMALVPDDATALLVTDYDQLRLQLGSPTLTSKDPAKDRAKFWRRVDGETAALSPGLLRPFDGRLRSEYGFTQDDVLWEAHFGNAEVGEQGWVLRFRDDLDMTGVQRAVDDGVGPLAGVQVATEQRVIGMGTTSDPEESWAALGEEVALVGTPAASTYVERSCIAVDDAFGEGLHDQLAAGPAEDLAKLEDLGPFAVAFGGDLATVRLGPDRGDTFARARLADTLPEGDPSFAEGFQRPVADPAGGRIGYLLGDPRVAAELTLTRRLPFALCAD